MDALFEEWQNRHFRIGNKYFVRDGTINQRIWDSQNIRICFFLKEAYQKDAPIWDLTKWLCNENGGDGAVVKMWRTVAEFTYGLLNTNESNIPSYSQAKSLTQSDRSKLLQNISVVNVKKSNGESHSEWSDLVKYAKADADLLCREIDLISPNIIVCGNNSSLLRIIYGASVDEKGNVYHDGIIDEKSYCFMNDNGYFWFDNKLIIDFYHPANQFPKIMNFYTLCCIYQKALKEKKI